MRILQDEELDMVPLKLMCTAIRQHIEADARGEATSPPRHIVNMPQGGMNFTAGGGEGYAGFKAYETLGSAPKEADEQVVAGWNTEDGRLLGVALGDRLGALRTGCIGGIALDIMASRNAKILAVIGTGQQAETQLDAALELREFEDIRLFSRRPVAANDLAKKIRHKTKAKIHISATPEEAVHNADVVLLVTNSGEAVVDADWIAPDAHVSTIGPKTRQRHELPLAIVRRARVIASDSPQQILDQADHFLKGQRVEPQIKHLGSLIGKFDPDRNRGMTLFLSSGLGGTEVAALKAAVDFLDQS